ncbi:MAG: Uncharacterised protein [Synechococcus sp. CC9902]|nr:MAG: Uncharacterised protein [Synechococcus sp. CC9902]
MVLQPPHHGFGQGRRLLPSQPRALQSKLIPQPFPQIGASHPQRRNTDQLADGIQFRHAGFAGEDDAAGETGTVSFRHLRQEVLQFRVQLIDSDHQQRVVFNGIQKSGDLGSEVRRLQPHQQLAAPAGAEMHQCRKVVFAQARFAADHQCSTVRIL